MRIHVFLNGQQRQVAAGITVADLLAELGRPPVGIAVEINQEVVPRSEHVSRQLADGDRIEIVHMVGGG